MEQGFDDKELSDIMKEIEALEVEYSADADTKPSDKSVIEELVDISESNAILRTNLVEPAVLNFNKAPVSTPKNDAQASKAPTSLSKTHSSMSFKVQGDLQLDLNFEIGGKVISLAVSENGLTIQMEGGMTFNVPVSDAHSLKKAV